MEDKTTTGMYIIIPTVEARKQLRARCYTLPLDRLLSCHRLLKELIATMHALITNGIDFDELFDFQLAKLQLLESVIMFYGQKDFRVLPAYFPLYLETLLALSNPSQGFLSEWSDFDRLQSLKTFESILDIINNRKSKFVVIEATSKYLNADSDHHYKNTFGELYLHYLSKQYLQHYTVIDLLKKFIHNNKINSTASMKECALITRILTGEKTDMETNEHYLDRLSAVFFIHHECAFTLLHDEVFDPESSYSDTELALVNLSHEEGMIHQQKDEPIHDFLLDLASLLRVAKLIQTLGRSPSAQFFKHIAEYCGHCAKLTPNYLQAADKKLLDTLFCKAKETNSFIHELSQLFEESDILQDQLKTINTHSIKMLNLSQLLALLTQPRTDFISTHEMTIKQLRSEDRENTPPLEITPAKALLREQRLSCDRLNTSRHPHSDQLAASGSLHAKRFAL